MKDAKRARSSKDLRKGQTITYREPLYGVWKVHTYTENPTGDKWDYENNPVYILEDVPQEKLLIGDQVDAFEEIERWHEEHRMLATTVKNSVNMVRHDVMQPLMQATYRLIKPMSLHE